MKFCKFNIVIFLTLAAFKIGNLQAQDAETIKKMAISQGMQTMFDDGLEKVKKGLTSLEEIMRVSKE